MIWKRINRRKPRIAYLYVVQNTYQYSVIAEYVEMMHGSHSRDSTVLLNSYIKLFFRPLGV